MTVGTAMRHVGDPTLTGSLAHGARTRRWRELGLRFPELGSMRVLDLGGTSDMWRIAPIRPAHVTTVNLVASDRIDEPWFEAVVGDACDLPMPLRRDHFDLVFSNSLIEHLGGHWRRQRFAETVASRGSFHWVQTPYRYFPIEPHWLFPGMQFLPYAARVFVSSRWRRGHVRTITRAQAEEKVSEIELLSTTQMRRLFESSEIWYERFAGLPKSIVAIGS